MHVINVIIATLDNVYVMRNDDRAIVNSFAYNAALHIAATYFQIPP